MWIKNLPQIKLELGAAKTTSSPETGLSEIVPLLQGDSAFQGGELEHSIKDAVQMMNALKHPLILLFTEGFIL